MRTIAIKLDNNDFIEIKKCVLKNLRPKLSADFADFASVKIQEFGEIKCWLKNRHNYLSDRTNCNYT
jgi:hypothetical protein